MAWWEVSRIIIVGARMSPPCDGMLAQLSHYEIVENSQKLGLVLDLCKHPHIQNPYSGADTDYCCYARADGSVKGAS